jgi:hypothetical protein
VKKNFVLNRLGMKDYKRKKVELPKMRIPLPKQRNQAFKDHTKYDRKNKGKGKGVSDDSFSFYIP